MKSIFAFLLYIVILSSCSQSALSKKLSGSDSLVISFNQLNSDSIAKMVATTEKTAIKKLIRFIDGKETEKFKCGYDGNLVFYKEGKELLPIVFKYKDKDCRHFLLELDGKLLSNKMNKEAADFLQSLQEGKTWY